MNKKTIHSIDFVAVRGAGKYWLAKVVSTGKVLSSPAKKSRPALWREMEDIAKYRGKQLFVSDTLTYV